MIKKILNYFKKKDQAEEVLKQLDEFKKINEEKPDNKPLLDDEVEYFVISQTDTEPIIIEPLSTEMSRTFNIKVDDSNPEDILEILRNKFKKYNNKNEEQLENVYKTGFDSNVTDDRLLKRLHEDIEKEKNKSDCKCKNCGCEPVEDHLINLVKEWDKIAEPENMEPIKPKKTRRSKNK